MEIIEKKKKEKIPSAVRNIVWNTYIGFDTKVGKCLCCNSELISFPNFDCGHIISDANGGEIKIQNLRPICGNCNGSMGKENMEVFMEKYGIVKSENWNGVGIKKVKEEVVIIEEVDNDILNKTCTTCSICDKRFTCHYNLKLHKNKKIKCSKTPNHCKYCNKKFARRSTMLRHIKDSCEKEESKFYKEKFKDSEETLIKEKQIIDEKLKLIAERKLDKQ
jgi:hypothetical protein